MSICRLTEYYYCDCDVNYRHIILPEESNLYCLGGTCYNCTGFNDGTIIHTASIKHYNDDIDVATSKDGNIYQLVHPHPDYYDLLLARESEIPIINSWYLSGNREDGYVLHGKRVDHKEVSGKVTKQDGNYVWLDGIMYYVIWYNLDIPSKKDAESLFDKGKYLDLDIYNDFSLYLYVLSKPIFFK